MSRFSIRLLFVVFAALGIYLLPSLPFKLLPDQILPSIHVTYSLPGSSEAELERTVTSKLEGAFASQSDLRKIFSRSHAGHGEIQLEFENGTDIEQKKIEVARIVRDVHPKLPSGTSYPLTTNNRPESNDVRIVSYSMVSINESDIKKLFETILLPRLSKINNVRSINFNGLPNDVLTIRYKNERLSSIGISETDLARCIESAISDSQVGNIISSSGSGKETLPTRLTPLASESQLLQIPIQKVGSRVITLNEIARIGYNKEEQNTKSRINGIPTAEFSILADTDANQLTLINEIDNVISEVSQDWPNVLFYLTYSSTDLLLEEMNTVGFQCLVSVLLVAITTWLFYRRGFYCLLIFVSLILSTLITIIFLKLFHVSMHVYSLMAITISLGFIIDNSVVAIDHYLHGKDSPFVSTLIAATLTNMAPLAAIFFVDDETKLNLTDFSWTLTFALLSSLIVSVFFIPSVIMLRETKKGTSISGRRKTTVWVTYHVSFINLLRRWRTVLTLVLILLFGFPFSLLPEHINDKNVFFGEAYNATFGDDYFINNVKPGLKKYLGGAVDRFVNNSFSKDFMPSPKRLAISIRIVTPFGSTIDYIDEICKVFETKLTPNLKSGLDFYRTSIHDKRNAQIDIFFIPDVDEAFPHALKAYLEKESLALSGLEFGIFGVGIPFGVNTSNTVDSNIVLYGYDYEKLEDYAQTLKEYLSREPRVADISIKSEPSWRVREDKKFSVIPYGTDALPILESIKNRFTTLEIGVVKMKEQTLAIKLTSDEMQQSSDYELMQTFYSVNDSLKYRPSKSADIELLDQPTTIVKKNQQYQIVVQYQFKGTPKHKDLFTKQTIDMYAPKLSPGFNIQGDNRDNLSNIDGRLFFSILISVAFIFWVCAILFNSITIPWVLIIIIPITLTGVLNFLNYMDLGLTQGVFTGLILLAGLLVNSSLFVVSDFFNVSRKGNAKGYGVAIVRKFRPIMITNISTIAGLLPFLAFYTRHEFWFPFAVTLCSGICISTLVIAFFLPIYLIRRTDD